MDEDALLRWLRRRTARRGGRWIGDDAAILPQTAAWAVTMDSQVEGVHFSAGLDVTLVARRLLAVNLSDLAAMGALPAYAFLALCAPEGFDHRRFLGALADACEKYSLDLAGGDLSRHSKLTVTLTLLGRRPNRQRWLRRSDAREGEGLWVGGSLGEAAAGLHLLDRGATIEGRTVRFAAGHGLPKVLLAAARRAVLRQLKPVPQLELGRWLGGGPTGAVIDISDGLARDLHRLCAASGVGAEIELERLPVPRSFHRLCRAIDREWQDLTLAGGEDYVLLFTLPAGRRPPERFRCTRIGNTTGGSDVRLRQADTTSTLPPRGWDHLSRED